MGRLAYGLCSASRRVISMYAVTAASSSSSVQSSLMGLPTASVASRSMVAKPRGRIGARWHLWMFSIHGVCSGWVSKLVPVVIGRALRAGLSGCAPSRGASRPCRASIPLAASCACPGRAQAALGEYGCKLRLLSMTVEGRWCAQGGLAVPPTVPPRSRVQGLRPLRGLAAVRPSVEP